MNDSSQALKNAMASPALNSESSDNSAAAGAQFHVTLCTADMDRSVRFYECLLGRSPTLRHGNYARFELERPALVLLLYNTTRPPGGALSHVGLRVGTSAELVEIQQRLESAGIATQRQDGVECCYARQTKFWATDPDGLMWELYILEEDIDHSGFDDPPLSKPEPVAQAVWMHRLTEPLPARIPHDNSSLDEVRLEGTYNVPLSDATRASLLAEIQRVLRPGGRIILHGMVGDRPLDREPKLPGLASLVRHVPVEHELQAELAAAGFTGIFYETLSDVNCIGIPGMDLRHGLLVGLRPAGIEEAADQYVLYRGPLVAVTDEQGTVFQRGERMAVTAAKSAQLRSGPAADQFVFFATREADTLLPQEKGCC